jgi:dTDP-4-amino-4,6-dideoxygalactose transaminase
LAGSGIPVHVEGSADYQTRHVYNQFVIRCSQRDALQAHLTDNGIGTEIYYPLPLHLQPCYAHLGYKKGNFPISEKLATETLSLPIQAELAAEDIDRICDSIRSFYT